MSFLTPLGLLGLLALPVIVLLHLFRRRYLEHRVAGLFLWEPDILRSQSGRKRTRLLHSASLWIELLAASLAALALAGLDLGVSPGRKPIVLVLDDSASMSALSGNTSVRDRVVGQIHELLDAAGSAVRCTVISSGRHNRVMVGPGATHQEVRSALTGWQPTQPAHELGPALAMGRQMAPGSADLYLFTDADPGTVDPTFDVRALGQELGNAALLSARRIRSAQGERLFVDLISYRDEAIDTQVEVRLLLGDGEPRLYRSPVRLDTGQVHHIALDLPAHPGAIQIDLQDDAMAIDNRILLLPESLRVVRLEDRLPKTVSSQLGLEQVIAAIPGLDLARPGDRASLLLTTEPGTAEPWRTELLLQVPETSSALIGPFLLERRHPLLQGVQLLGVIWSASESSSPTGFPLVLAGDIPLITEEKQPRFRRFRLGIDPARSNLAKSPDWPILWSNLVNLVRKELPGQVVRNQASTEDLVYRHAGPLDEIPEMRLHTPAGGEQRATSLRELRFAPEGPGSYRLMRGDAELAHWSLHFVDAMESDLRARGSMTRRANAEGDVREGSSSQPGDWERSLLTLLLFLLVLADWWALKRGEATA